MTSILKLKNHAKKRLCFLSFLFRKEWEREEVLPSTFRSIPNHSILLAGQYSPCWRDGQTEVVNSSSEEDLSLVRSPSPCSTSCKTHLLPGSTDGRIRRLGFPLRKNQPHAGKFCYFFQLIGGIKLTFVYFSRDTFVKVRCKKTAVSLGGLFLL